MFVFDPMAQGLELLARRELQRAEDLFLRVINDPYAQNQDLLKARGYLNDIRACQVGDRELDFSAYKKLARQSPPSLDKFYTLLESIYFSKLNTYQEFDGAIADGISGVIYPLKQVKISDIVARDKLFETLEKKGLAHIKSRLKARRRTCPG